MNSEGKVVEELVEHAKALATAPNTSFAIGVARCMREKLLLLIVHWEAELGERRAREAPPE